MQKQHDWFHLRKQYVYDTALYKSVVDSKPLASKDR
jgi:hypothetical protein